MRLHRVSCGPFTPDYFERLQWFLQPQVQSLISRPCKQQTYVEKEGKWYYVTPQAKLKKTAEPDLSLAMDENELLCPVITCSFALHQGKVQKQ